MNITGINGIGTKMQSGIKIDNNMQMDSISKNIQNQIANAQKKLQDLSDDKEMSAEDKMKKRKEIQQEIASLHQQLRQHQALLRKEKQQKSLSVDEMSGGSHKPKTAKAGSKGMQAMSQATMTALISADSSMKQAQVQGAMATKMEGRAGVLESEIKADKARGGNTEAKEAELADLQERIKSSNASQISTLADAKETMEEAAKVDRETEKTEKKTDKTEGKSDKNKDNKANGIKDDENKTESAAAHIVSQSVEHNSIDICL